MPNASTAAIQISIRRDGNEVFSGRTDVGQMARSFEDLVHWLGRDNSFPSGVMLMTGTGIVPDSSFTLYSADEIRISIDGIGTLVNSVVQG
jgi:2-dehydro-3-deoxy-D-arabinonate dehydratase